MTKVLDGLAKSTNLSANFFGAGASLNVEKLTDVLSSKGSVLIGTEKIYYREQHIRDYLEDCVEQFLNEKKDAHRRIVIFVDDLDQCTPEKALELLESIKTFFDIEGIIYVIGMDPKSIDSIISVKYGKESRIGGLEYLQKIVQLPFSIPVWSSPDLTDPIKEMIVSIGLSQPIVTSLLEKTNIGLIIKSAKLNPRNVKRFINSIILSLSKYAQNTHYIEGLISIQAFYFHGEKWLQLLELIIPYNDRVLFLQDFIVRTRERPEIFNQEDLSKFVKEIPNIRSKLNSKIIEIYRKIADINDDDLFMFLKESAKSLLKIDKIENYLRVADETKKIDTNTIESNVEIKGLELLDELNRLKLKQNELEAGIKKFNISTKGCIIHLPYADLTHQKLKGIYLSKAFLFKADLQNADLSKADLSRADLRYANLSEANLSEAYLYRTDLSRADLRYAILSEANLLQAQLVRTDLSNSCIINSKNYQLTSIK